MKKQNKWYDSGIKVVFFFITIIWLIGSLSNTIFHKNIQHELGIGLIICSLWQLILTATGHYK